MTAIRFLMISLLSFLLGCDRSPEVRAGNICTVDDGEGFFRVAKVLAVDEQGFHIRVYKNRWTQRPTAVDTKTLSLGSVQDKEGFGMGHLPLTKRAFAAWKPVVIGTETVADGEMDGYKMWKDGGGGYFGDK